MTQRRGDRAAAAELKRLGIRIAVDDFGTGYSSLSHLRQFPVDVLKIDRSFISQLAEGGEGEILLHTLVQLGKALEIETTAEGIEQPAGPLADHATKSATTARASSSRGRSAPRTPSPSSASGRRPGASRSATSARATIGSLSMDRWGLTLPLPGLTLAEHEELVKRAEAAGYTDLWSGETNGPDGFTPLALSAAWTERARLGPGSSASSSAARRCWRRRRRRSPTPRTGASCSASAPPRTGSSKAGTGSPSSGR